MTAVHRVSALVVTYDHEDEIAACLEGALAQAGDGLEVEVVVVDNASSDGTLEVLRGFGDRITLVASPRNTGFAEGVNAAFERATGDAVLLLNPDVVMDPGCLLALAEHLRAEPAAAGAAALLRSVDGSPQLFCRRDPGPLDLFLNHTSPGRRLDARLGWRGHRRWRYADLWERGVREPVPVFAPAAACVLFERSALAPRPLDPAFPIFFNDGDLYARLRTSGRRVDLVPAATAAHGYGTSVQRASAADRGGMRAEWIASSLRYVRRHHGAGAAALAWLAYLLDAAWGLGAHVTGRGTDRTRGQVLGGLGGLGVPGGTRPFLSRPLGRGR